MEAPSPSDAQKEENILGRGQRWGVLSLIAIHEELLEEEEMAPEQDSG